MIGSDLCQINPDPWLGKWGGKRHKRRGKKKGKRKRKKGDLWEFQSRIPSEEQEVGLQGTRGREHDLSDRKSSRGARHGNYILEINGQLLNRSITLSLFILFSSTSTLLYPIAYSSTCTVSVRSGCVHSRYCTGTYHTRGTVHCSYRCSTAVQYVQDLWSSALSHDDCCASAIFLFQTNFCPLILLSTQEHTTTSYPHLPVPVVASLPYQFSLFCHRIK